MQESGLWNSHPGRQRPAGRGGESELVLDADAVGGDKIAGHPRVRILAVEEHVRHGALAEVIAVTGLQLAEPAAAIALPMRHTPLSTTLDTDARVVPMEMVAPEMRAASASVAIDMQMRMCTRGRERTLRE